MSERLDELQKKELTSEIKSIKKDIDNILNKINKIENSDEFKIIEGVFTQKDNTKIIERMCLFIDKYLDLSDKLKKNPEDIELKVSLVYLFTSKRVEEIINEIDSNIKIDDNLKLKLIQDIPKQITQRGIELLQDINTLISSFKGGENNLAGVNSLFLGKPLKTELSIQNSFKKLYLCILKLLSKNYEITEEDVIKYKDEIKKIEEKNSLPIVEVQKINSEKDSKTDSIQKLENEFENLKKVRLMIFSETIDSMKETLKEQFEIEEQKGDNENKIVENTEGKINDYKNINKEDTFNNLDDIFLILNKISINLTPKNYEQNFEKIVLIFKLILKLRKDFFETISMDEFCSNYFAGILDLIIDVLENADKK